MSEPKLCSYCKSVPQANTWTLHGISETRYFCPNPECPHSVRTVTLEEWQTRPIEDALNARIAELEAHIAALKAKKRQQAVIASLIRVGDEMADKLNGLGITAFDHEWAKCKSWLEEGGEG